MCLILAVAAHRGKRVLPSWLALGILLAYGVGLSYVSDWLLTKAIGCLVNKRKVKK